MTNEITTAGVIGAGTMGCGIAQVCALAGYVTILYDVNDQILKRGIETINKNLAQGIEKGKISQLEADSAREKVKQVKNLEDVQADLIIEAVIENLEIKKKLFARIEALNPGSILATNTSSIGISQISAGLKLPAQCVGLHFFNPAHIMKLVEVVSGTATSIEVTKQTRDFALSLGKIPVMAKDSPGFIVNRVARHYYVESLKLLEDKVATVATIDQLMESLGFKMGPYRLMDLIGVDTNLSVTKSVYEGFNQASKFKPSEIQQQKVDAGEWGRKTGKGFYDYSK
jgi:3-hydroxybutyryl-CoA dehydrogenase